MINKSKFSQIIENYQVVIFDIWGVIYEGFDPYEGVVAAINNLIIAQKKVIFLSNTPRPNYITALRLKNFGILVDQAEVYTSGDLVREYINHTSKKIFHLGQVVNQDLLADLVIETVTDINQAEVMIISMFTDNEKELDKYDDILKIAVAKKIEVICANPDTKIKSGDKYLYCSGVFAQRLINFGGQVKFFGKPESNAYEKILNKLHQDGMNKILMIGDTAETDILGAKRAKIDSALVLSGNGLTSLNSETKPTWIVDGVAF